MSYLFSPPSPKALIRSMRLEFRARMLGVGALAGTVVVAPFVFACSCPSYHVHYAHPISAERLLEAAEMPDEDEACALLCGGPVESCETARMVPGAPNPTTRNLYSTVHPTHLAEGEERAEPTPLVVCEVVETQMCGIGRPPEGLVRETRQAGRSKPLNTHLAAYASHAAHIEAASAIAFVQLATELEAHGAPRRFIVAAERSAADEVRHARAAAVLARSLGATVQSPRVEVPAPRPLHEVLRENASVGSVEEGYGAWVLQHQATRARHAGVRKFTQAIVDDEMRHSAFADALDAWGRDKIPQARRAENVEARDLAWAEQLSGLPAHSSFADLVGLPSVDAASSWLTSARSMDART